MSTSPIPASKLYVAFPIPFKQRQRGRKRKGKERKKKKIPKAAFQRCHLSFKLFCFGAFIEGLPSFGRPGEILKPKTYGPFKVSCSLFACSVFHAPSCACLCLLASPGRPLLVTAWPGKHTTEFQGPRRILDGEEEAQERTRENKREQERTKDSGDGGMEGRGSKRRAAGIVFRWFGHSQREREAKRSNGLRQGNNNTMQLPPRDIPTPN